MDHQLDTTSLAKEIQQAEAMLASFCNSAQQDIEVEFNQFPESWRLKLKFARPRADC